MGNFLRWLALRAPSVRIGFGAKKRMTASLLLLFSAILLILTKSVFSEHY
jgi:hypothetical protein